MMITRRLNAMRCRIIGLLLIPVLLLSCKSSSPRFAREVFLNKLVGIDASCIDSVPGVIDRPQIVMLCSIYDCGSCLAKAFEEIEYIQSRIPSCNIQIIGVLSNPSILQERFSYEEYIAFDESDIIRKRLKFAPTPLIIGRDYNSIITWLHCSSSEDNNREVFKSYMSTLQ